MLMAWPLSGPPFFMPCCAVWVCFPGQLFNRCSQALERFILMLHCLEQSGEQDTNIVFVNIRNPSGNLAARDNLEKTIPIGTGNF
jgi:hypothetical protein